MNTRIFGRTHSGGIPLILDGAMGSLLQMKGIRADEYLWTCAANIEHPEIVRSIHEDYIKAGADIITTNTFRSNPAAVGFSESAKCILYTNSAVTIAKEARGERSVLIAGSNAPAEDCYQKNRTLSSKDLEYNHKKHIDILYSAGCDFILNETMSHSDEIRIVCDYCSKMDIPYLLSIYFTNDLKILSGEPVSEILKLVSDFNPISTGFNCIFPSDIVKLSKIIPLNFSWGYYLNAGSGNTTDSYIECGISAEKYLETVYYLEKFSPDFIGACCGSDTTHIQSIKHYYYGLS